MTKYLEKYYLYKILHAHMKKYLTIFAVAIACLLACEKNLDDGAGTDPEHALTPEQEFWSVVGQLVNVNDITPDYQGKTFLPEIGSEVEPGVRVVGVNSLEAAVRKYNTLTGADIDTLTASHSYSSKVVGSLIWNKNTDNKAWGTVDVNIPAVPTLSKIIYRSPKQGDVNGGVADGQSAYYRFGDVVKHFREEDGQLEYWICVRPAFDYEGKGESHWVSVSPLPKSNIWPYYETNEPFTASNKLEYALPYNIREDTEWYQDLAEMLFAIFYPEQWFSNITSYSSESMFGSPRGLPIFNDFHCTLKEYHNEYFWSNVQSRWRSNNLVKTLFGISYEEMEEALKQPIAGAPAGRGIHLLYKGHSWWTKTSNKPQLWEAHYSNKGTKDVEKNMHTFDPVKPSAQVVNPRNPKDPATNYSIDVYNLSLEKPYLKEARFFGDDAPRWIIRYATGKELAENGVWNPQLPMYGFEGENEVYRYYRDVNLKNLSSEPEITDKIENVLNDKAKQDISRFYGDSHYRIGDVLQDQNGHRWIVVKESGESAEGYNLFPEYSPYTELISFDGIKYSADKKTATNIVTRQQAIRFMHLIWLYSQEANKHIKREYTDNEVAAGGAPSFWPIFSTVRDKAEVDLHHLSDELALPKYNSNVIGVGESWSLAYYEPGSDRQHLLRCIVQMDIKGGAFLNMMNDRYPADTTRTADSYWNLSSNSFSQDYIYLDDVADQQKVNKYGNDFVARTPLSANSGIPRPFRTQAEARAVDASNYAYKMSTWKEGSQPTGMWNEPVLLFRATAIYDRGDSQFATITVDGLQLAKKGNGGYEKELGRAADYRFLGQAAAYNDKDSRHLNGSTNSIPSWESIWK